MRRYMHICGFHNSPAESTFYVKREGDVLLSIALYVNDMLLTSPK